MDVCFNGLPDNATTIFGGWVPAALLNVKHDAREKLCQKDVFLTRQKIKTAHRINFISEPDVDFVAYQTASQPIKSVEHQLRD